MWNIIKKIIENYNTYIKNKDPIKESEFSYSKIYFRNKLNTKIFYKTSVRKEGKNYLNHREFYK